MRRGIGVAHVQQQRQTQQQMADLGAQITAERVSHIHDELETFEAQLRQLAKNHHDDIRTDPVVRARFRQLADSLGLDLISSKKNVFAGVLGLGDFYYALAGKVVEACMLERRFCGSYVPLRRVVEKTQISVNATLTTTTKQRGNAVEDVVRISEEDVLTAIKKLSCLGEGFNVVELGGVKYIQTTPDGKQGTDTIQLINYALTQQRAKLLKTKNNSVRGASPAKPAAVKAPPTTSPPSTSALGAAYVLGAHPMSADGDVMAASSLTDQCISLTKREIIDALSWPEHRATAALQYMIQAGSVWVDYPHKDEVGAKLAAPTLVATESKEVWRRAKKSTTVFDDGAVYWFVALTTAA